MSLKPTYNTAGKVINFKKVKVAFSVVLYKIQLFK